jgi:alpha-L-rhamnosidase
MPGFNATEWKKAHVVTPPGGELRSHAMEPVMVTEEIRPQAVWESDPGVFVFDMGQNFSGWCRLTVAGKRGDTVVLRHSENIDSHGRLDPITNNRALNEDSFILRGLDTETFEPCFTYHGFQYVEVTGFPGTPTLDTLTGCVTHSATEQTGSFQCGNELVNRIQHCTLWSQRSNMMGMPTDDNQRDERIGWMGDAHVTAEECMHNFDAARFYRKWLRDIKHGQSKETGDVPHVSPRPHVDGTPCWSSAYPLVVWYAYNHYGDRRLLEEHYDGLKQYVDFLTTTASGHILPIDRYGDWFSPIDNAQRGEPLLATTFYYYYNTQIVAQTAELLGRKRDAGRYRRLAAAILKAFNETYFSSDKKYGRGTQCETAMPLLLDMVPADDRDSVEKWLEDLISFQRKDHLTTGILGTQYVFDVLLKTGRNDLAWRIVNGSGYPSYRGMIEGRTTLSERWDQDVSGTNNHIMFGSVSTWFYRALAGIRPVEGRPGYEAVRIEPYIPEDLAWASGAIETVRGRIASAWRKQGGTLELSVTIPVNTLAEVVFPAAQVQGAVTEGRKAIATRKEHGRLIVKIGSGSYGFSCAWISAERSG